MLTILGNPQEYSRRLIRRDFLRIGAAGPVLGLTERFAHQALARPADSPTAKPAKSVIMAYLLGGPAQLDTYDPKPEAPAEYRGPFKPIKTNVAGLEISELFPKQAAMMDKFALIRSLQATAPNNHSDSEVMTGRNEVANARFQHPAMGAVVSKLLHAGDGAVPGYVALRKMSFPTKTPLPQSLYYLNAAALGGTHAPFLPTGPGLDDFEFPASMETHRFRDRMHLLSRFDRLRRDLDASGNMAALDSFQGRAADILTSRRLRDALDLDREDPRIVERYSLPGASAAKNQLFAPGYKQGTQLSWSHWASSAARRRSTTWLAESIGSRPCRRSLPAEG